jgi:hypothetical protein
VAFEQQPVHALKRLDIDMNFVEPQPDRVAQEPMTVHGAGDILRMIDIQKRALSGELSMRKRPQTWAPEEAGVVAIERQKPHPGPFDFIDAHNRPRSERKRNITARESQRRWVKWSQVRGYTAACSM